MNTIVLPCNCTSEFQDKVYGKGMRLHNASQKPKTKIAYCTVCSTNKVDRMTAGIKKGSPGKSY